MNYYALVIGIAVAIYVVIRFRKTRLEKKQWVYPMLLATFPVYYWAFAVYGSDYAALTNELAIGVGFLAVTYVAYRLDGFIGLLLLATGYMMHAAYDIAHNALFLNSGAPLWWPEFCGAVDMLIGMYLLFFALSMKSRAELN